MNIGAFIDILPSTLFKLFMAILCGGIIGAERQLTHKPAGLRTNILICLGATLYTTLSVFVATHAVGEGSKIVPDPGRIAAQIVTGIGFLGGGIIIQSRGNVTGLTTAATIWVVAAIGLCIGMGYPFLALTFTLSVWSTLYLLNVVVHRFLGKTRGFKVSILVDKESSQSRAEVIQVFHYMDIDLQDLEVVKHKDKNTWNIEVFYYSSEARHLRMKASLWSIKGVRNVEVRPASKKKRRKSSS